MRVGLTVSSTAHVAIIAASLMSFPAPDAFDISGMESVPVDVVSIEEFTRITAGVAEGEAEVEPSAPVAEVEQPEAVEVPEPESQETELAALPPEPEPIPVQAPEPAPEAETPAPEAELAPEAEPAEETNVPTPVSRPRDIPDRPQRPPEPELENNQFDPNRIAALLDRTPDQPAPQATTQSLPQNQQASLGAPNANDARITQSEMDYLRQRIAECWSPPVGAINADALIVKVRMQLDRGGNLVGVPFIVESAPGIAGQAAGDSALRAVRRCQPYDQLPQDKFDIWQTVEVRFDPSQMLR